jgi:hypothetical protein
MVKNQLKVMEEITSKSTGNFSVNGAFDFSTTF